MPPVIRGSQRPDQLRQTHSNPAVPSPSSPVRDRRVTFDQHREDSSTSAPTARIFSSRRSASIRRPSPQHRRSHDLDEEERDVYYDSRAATRREFRRRGSTLQSYY